MDTLNEKVETDLEVKGNRICRRVAADREAYREVREKMKKA